MGSMARKLKRQQPSMVMRPPFAQPIEEPPEKVRMFGEECYKFGRNEGYDKGFEKGYNEGFEKGYGAACGYMMANMAYIWKYHEDIFDNPSNRLQIYFQLMKLFSEEYVQHRTPKMLAALDDLRRQGIEVEIKGDINGIYSK